MPTILALALPNPLRRLFEYLAPEGADPATSWRIGQRFSVPFGASQTLCGVLVEIRQSPTVAPEKLRHAYTALDNEPVLDSELLTLCRWVSNYYHHPLGEVIHAALPAALRRPEPSPTPAASKAWAHTPEGKGLPREAHKRSAKQRLLHQYLLDHEQIGEAELRGLGISGSVVKAMANKGLIAPAARRVTAPPASLLAESGHRLNDEQEAALQQLRYHHFGVYLLEGTTGSGKTEVYLQAITRVLMAGRQALVLIPEIGLTPQTLARFRQRFAVPVVELHSHVADGKRHNHWAQAASGEARIVVGTRLAVFTPMPNLGIIVIDEEHDLSFKQQDGLRYCARDIAVVRAQKLNIPLLMGSATPSLETLHNAIQGRFEHLRLTRRAGAAQPPQLSLVDLRGQRTQCGFSEKALGAIEHTLSDGNQVLVFINRRGFAPALLCHQCGWCAGCTACDARMTLHARPPHLRCHHCNQQRPVPSICPACQNPELSTQGSGTERAEDFLAQRFPQVPTTRVDQDAMKSKRAMADLMQELQQGDPRILVGTQMLAKGHHFPKVTLAVILAIDQGLFSGDFRGPERMGQLLIQVAGRAGRGEQSGRVIVQTHHPDHPLLATLLQQGYHRFARALMAERRPPGLPPFGHMALLRAESKRPENAVAFLEMAKHAARRLQPPTPQYQYLGPVPALMERRNDRWRFQLQLCFAQRSTLHAVLHALVNEIEGHALARRTRWSLDVDPLDMA